MDLLFFNVFHNCFFFWRVFKIGFMVASSREGG